MILQNGKVDKYLFSGGYCQNTDSNLAFNYFNQDHLGNIREVVDSNGKVVQTNNYYPFGTPFYDEANTTNASLQPFKYNGKELDMMHGLNTYDYGARQYYAALPTWDRVDPLAEKYYSTSPYAYCGNNPVNRLDPDGRDWYQTGSGNLYWNPKVKSQEDLQDGYTYVGEKYIDEENNITYKSDGSVLCENEYDGVKRMNLQNERSKTKDRPHGKEQSACILPDGRMLVLPDNWNNEHESKLPPGAKLTSTKFVAADGSSYNVSGYVHTHPNKRQDSFSVADGDFGMQRPNLPLLVLHEDGNLYYSIQPAYSYIYDHRLHYRCSNAGSVNYLRKNGITMVKIANTIRLNNKK